MTVLRFSDMSSIFKRGLAVRIDEKLDPRVIICGGAGFTEQRGVITVSEITGPLLKAAGSCQMTIWAETVSGETMLLVCEALSAGNSLLSGNNIEAGKKFEPTTLKAISDTRDGLQGK